MEKIAESTISMITQFIENNSNHSTINKKPIIYPQMPTFQIEHYLKLAATKNNLISIQFNPTPSSPEFTEIRGKIKLALDSNHIILIPPNDKMIHLVQSKLIRHLRLINL